MAGRSSTRSRSPLAGGGLAINLPGPRTAAWVALLVVIVAAVVVLAILRSAPPAASGPTPVNPAVEERYGIRLLWIGVSADGGLVDMRYLVLDANEASYIIESPETAPKLIVEDTGKRLDTAVLMGSSSHTHGIVEGRTAFLLFRNTRGAIHRGALLTVDFGDLRIEHVPVQ